MKVINTLINDIAVSPDAIVFRCKQKCVEILKCLEYANGDVVQAKKVCATFCDFRLAEGWDLVLSAPEMQDSLRSRVHTLTERRDK